MSESNDVVSADQQPGGPISMSAPGFTVEDVASFWGGLGAEAHSALFDAIRAAKLAQRIDWSELVEEEQRWQFAAVQVNIAEGARGMVWANLSNQAQQRIVEVSVKKAEDARNRALAGVDEDILKMLELRVGWRDFPPQTRTEIVVFVRAAVSAAVRSRGVAWATFSNEEKWQTVEEAVHRLGERQRLTQPALNPLACPFCGHDDRVQKISGFQGAITLSKLKGKASFTSVNLSPEGWGAGFGGGPIEMSGTSTTALAARLVPPPPPTPPWLWAGHEARRSYAAALRRYAVADALWQGMYYCARDDGVYWPGGFGFKTRDSGQALIPWTVGRLFKIEEYWTTLWAAADAGVGMLDPGIWVGAAAIF
jgi:hypothetical protein